MTNADKVAAERIERSLSGSESAERLEKWIRPSSMVLLSGQPHQEQILEDIV